MSMAAMAAPNLVQIRPWGLLGKWVKYNECNSKNHEKMI